MHFVVAQVLNIIAELKPPHRKEVIEMLKKYGFRCMKYSEAYDMVLRSDSYFKFENARMVFDRAGQSAGYQSFAFYGILCDESPTGNFVVDDAEVVFIFDLQSKVIV
jgi:hypothetical protein